LIESLKNKLDDFVLVILSFLFTSIESRILLKIIKQKNESIDHISEHQPTFSTTLENDQTTFHSNIHFQSLITKPNSYLYNPDDDDEILLNRVKRDPTPFVCKGKILDCPHFIDCFSMHFS
jgi:hypothetical protein